MAQISTETQYVSPDATWLAALSAGAEAFRRVAAKRLRQRRVYRETMNELLSLSTREINELGLDTSLFHQWAKEKARLTK